MSKTNELSNCLSISIDMQHNLDYDGLIFDLEL